MACEIIEHRIKNFRALTLTNGEYSLTILPEKGSDIISLRDEKTDTEFLWESPNGLCSDATTYEGGWQECFPTGGPAINYRGAQMPQDGEVQSLAWDVIATTQDRDEVSITLRVKTIKSPFMLTKKITLRTGTGMVEIDETAVNQGAEPLPLLWGHHIVFGGNFLNDACKIDSASKKIISSALPENVLTGQFEQNISGVWPLIKNKSGELIDISEVSPASCGTADLLFLKDFEDGWLAITNREKKVGIAYLFDPAIHPAIWMWQMYGGGAGYPWFGRAYALGLQPFTGMPDPHADNIDAVAGLPIVAAGAAHTTRLRFLLFRGLKGVGRISRDGVIVPRI